MSRKSSAAEAEPTPTPTPSSAERCVSDASAPGDIAELIERFADCRSIEELPPELRANPFIEHIVTMTPEEAAREIAAAKAHRRADALYGDDPERILAAIEAGTHPLLQSPR